MRHEYTIYRNGMKYMSTNDIEEAFAIANVIKRFHYSVVVFDECGDAKWAWNK